MILCIIKKTGINDPGLSVFYKFVQRCTEVYIIKSKDNDLLSLMAGARISGYYDDISHNPVRAYGNYNYTGLVASAMVEPLFGTVNKISPSLGIELNKNINSLF